MHTRFFLLEFIMTENTNVNNVNVDFQKYCLEHPYIRVREDKLEWNLTICISADAGGFRIGKVTHSWEEAYEVVKAMEDVYKWRGIKT